ncbi:MAG TPA: hypothetical protein VJV05_01710 [Pyrinomonadaceae bacterium]|nr:hypothetical protein [Pyrinomonadaceae bacterium]
MNKKCSSLLRDFAFLSTTFATDRVAFDRYLRHTMNEESSLAKQLSNKPRDSVALQARDNASLTKFYSTKIWIFIYVSF